MIQAAVLFCYPWDFRDEGIDAVIGRARDLGVTHLAVATSYHAGFFFHPHNPKQRVHLLDDGVVYFHPNEACYADGPIRPVVAAMSREQDWIRVIADAADGAGLKLMAWTVLLHNTRLGLMHPEATIQNVFGDSHPHALSPAHPASVALAKGLVRDLATHHPFEAILLEASNYRNRAHGGTWVTGHHHERMGIHFRPVERALLDLSFNPADMDQATAAGVDVAALRVAVRDHLEQYMAAAPDVPAALAETVEQFTDRYPALADYDAHFCRTEAALLGQLREVAKEHRVDLVGSADPAIDVVMKGVYGEPLPSIATITDEARAALLPSQRLMITLRLGFYGPGMGTPIVTESQMVEATRTAAAHGADMVAFYNYAEAPRRCVDWIKPALASGIMA